MLLQLTNGLIYIHSQGLIYRSIKPQNILISTASPITLPVMKWADFGLTKSILRSDVVGPCSSSNSMSETLCWLAPEILVKTEVLCQENGFNSATKQSDIFSAGCVYFYFLTRVHPFGNKFVNNKNIIEGNPINLTSKTRNFQDYIFSFFLTSRA